jgi:ParB family transcriptional regulator, chromosome partitioning protein
MGLKDKASKIDFGSLPGILAPLPVPDPGRAEPPSVAGSAGHRPKTAPGLMMAQAADQRSEILRENENLKTQVADLALKAARTDELQDELKAWDGAKATRLLDPRLIARSRWANRDERHFGSAAFEELKVEIANAGGNIQPVKVRPLAGGAEGSARYELVFGHRRLEACQQLNLPVLALVENLGDAALFVEMDRENRSRKDLSAWEQGVMYQRALQDGLFPSNRKLAEAVGADLSNVGKALALASLPEAVVAAFETPLELQYRWSKPLRDTWERDAAGMRRRAELLAKQSPRPNAKFVFEVLVGQSQASGQKGSGTVPPTAPAAVAIHVKGAKAGLLKVGHEGGATVIIEPAWLPAARASELADTIERFLATLPKPSR